MYPVQTLLTSDRNHLRHRPTRRGGSPGTEPLVGIGGFWARSGLELCDPGQDVQHLAVCQISRTSGDNPRHGCGVISGEERRLGGQRDVASIAGQARSRHFPRPPVACVDVLTSRSRAIRPLRPIDAGDRAGGVDESACDTLGCPVEVFDGGKWSAEVDQAVQPCHLTVGPIGAKPRGRAPVKTLLNPLCGIVHQSDPEALLRGVQQLDVTDVKAPLLAFREGIEFGGRRGIRGQRVLAHNVALGIEGPTDEFGVCGVGGRDGDGIALLEHVIHRGGVQGGGGLMQETPAVDGHPVGMWIRSDGAASRTPSPTQAEDAPTGSGVVDTRPPTQLVACRGIRTQVNRCCASWLCC